MVGIISFVLFIPIYLDETRLHGKPAAYSFSVGLLTGLILDTAIHGAFGTYDIAWQPGIVPLLVTALLVILLGLTLTAFTKLFNEQKDNQSPGTDRRTWPWLAIGPFFFLQLVIYQNIARLAALTGWTLPFAFGWTLLVQLLALFVIIWLLRRGWQDSRLIIPVAGAILIAVAVLSQLTQGAWLTALYILIGQTSLSVLLIAIVGAIGTGNQSKSFSSTTVASGLGMVLLVIFLLGYYAGYQIKLPYRNDVLELIAAVIVALCALSSLRIARERIHLRKFSLVTPLLALILLILPLINILLWQEAEESTGDGFPVKIMTYNLHNGFNTGGNLDMEALARVIEDNNPDIVALQEISRGWLVSGRLDMLSWLSQRLNMQYVYGPTADPLWGNALISRYPITECSNSELPPRDLFMLRGFTTVKIDTGNGNSLIVIATHFHHLNEDSDIRQLQAPVIIDAWNGAERTVIMGDLNARPDWPEMEMLREAGLIDAYEAAGSGDGFTYHSATPVERIDYIWVSPDLTVSEVKVPSSLASDHLPLMATIDK